jgi:hypothetical protein
MSFLRPAGFTIRKKQPDIVSMAGGSNPTSGVFVIFPHAVVVLWVVLLGSQIWTFVKRSEQPPVYDTLSYFQKAKNFWAAFGSPKPVNPLNLEPTFRPPGTVLMSYPVGFTRDFHGFYFRSVFMPIVVLIGAVYCAGFARRASPAWHWNLAIIAVLLSSTPMFFHFERCDELVSPLIWGLVDNFLAAVAGLAVATCARSICSSSLRWWIGAALVASFSIMVKPSGALVMGLTGSMWFLGNVLWIRLEPQGSPERARRRNLLRAGSLAALLIFAATLLICFHSRYLSPANLSFGTAAIEVMRAELRLPFAVFLQLVRASFGYVLPSALFLTWLCGLLYLLLRRQRPSSAAYKVVLAMLVPALLTCAFGVWFWIIGAAGATQIRYFFPFAMMAAIFTIPMASIFTERLPPWGGWTVRMMFLLPAANLLLLLSVANPSIAWQRWSGVNLSSGTFRPEISMAHHLISNIRQKQKRNAFLYSFYAGASTAVFESVGEFEAVIHPELPTFQIVRPVDWRRPSVFRTNEILNSDYFLFSPILDPVVREKELKQVAIQDFWQESELFHDWFSALDQKDGVTVVAEDPSMRLLQLVDARKFEAALAEFVASHSWPTSFTDANPQHWWSEEQIDSLRRNHPPVISDVNFGKSFQVKAVRFVRHGNETNLSIWWRRMDHSDDRQWYMFFHLVDSRGKPLSVETMRLATGKPPDQKHPIVLDVLTFPVPVGTTSIAVGIYNDQGVFLIPDHGTRDWNNRRMLLPLP